MSQLLRHHQGKWCCLCREVAATGTPTAVVLIYGRPLSTRWTSEHAPALVEAWLPGERGGEAIADILFGNYNPSGRLAITVPRHSGQLPMFYDYKPGKAYWMAARANSYVDIPATPLYPFGYGLSFTNYEFKERQISVTLGPPTTDCNRRLSCSILRVRTGDFFVTVRPQESSVSAVVCDDSSRSMGKEIGLFPRLLPTLGRKRHARTANSKSCWRKECYTRGTCWLEPACGLGLRKTVLQQQGKDQEQKHDRDSW